MGNRTTPDHITSLAPNEVFVCGTNLAGVPGRGAALFAHNHFANIRGLTNGFSGDFRVYGIATKDVSIKKPLLLSDIAKSVSAFLEAVENWCMSYPRTVFLVTPIGCGLAGYKPEQIAPMFSGAVYMPNVYLPDSFWQVLRETKK